jgi:recombination protein RecR
MASYPKEIQDAIDAFSKLPSVGPKTAERLVFYLLRQPAVQLKEFSFILDTLREHVSTCKDCFNFCIGEVCDICADPQRSKTTLCVVAYPQDVLAIEKTTAFQGRYHVLGGTIDTLDGITPEQLHIKQLHARVSADRITELILALNPDASGETTMTYLTTIFKQTPAITISQLGRGLPIGGDVEYADEVTLRNALNSRLKL